MRTVGFLLVQADCAYPVYVCYFEASRYSGFFDENIVPVPFMSFFNSRYFPTPLGRILPHSLALERVQVLESGLLRGSVEGGFFP